MLSVCETRMLDSHHRIRFAWLVEEELWITVIGVRLAPSETPSALS